MKFELHYFTEIFRHNKKEISSLNGIRAILIFLLFFGHMFTIAADSGKMEAIPDLLRNFSRNVSFILDVFFVLSGYLISAPLFRELDKKNSIDLKPFYIRRTLRIFPPYYIFILIQIFIMFSLMKVARTPEELSVITSSLYSIVYDIFYLSNYFPGTMLHGWSLSLEEQFYLIFPMFLILVFKHIPAKYRLHSLVFIYLLPFTYRLTIYYTIMEPMQTGLVETYEKLIYRPFQGHADSLFAGIIAAYIVEHKKDWTKFFTSNSITSKIIHLMIWFVLFAYNIFIYELDKGIASQVIRFNIINISTAFIMLFSMKKGLSNKFFSLPIFSPFAKLSYIAYLIHMLLIGFFMYAAFGNKQVIHFKDILIYWLPFSLLIFLFAYFYHLITERPFMLLKEKLTSNYHKEAMPRI